VLGDELEQLLVPQVPRRDDDHVARDVMPAVEAPHLVAAGGLLLAGAGDGAVELVRVQPEGRRPMPGAEFARGARLAAGERLGDR
jgi:methionyl-tRNA formyltransferase